MHQIVTYNTEKMHQIVTYNTEKMHQIGTYCYEVIKVLISQTKHSK